MSVWRTGFIVVSSILLLGVAAGCSASSGDSDPSGTVFTIVLLIALAVILVPRGRETPSKDVSELGRLPSKINGWSRMNAAWRKNPGNTNRSHRS